MMQISKPSSLTFISSSTSQRKLFTASSATTTHLSLFTRSITRKYLSSATYYPIMFRSLVATLGCTHITYSARPAARLFDISFTDDDATKRNFHAAASQESHCQCTNNKVRSVPSACESCQQNALSVFAAAAVYSRKHVLRSLAIITAE